MTTSDPGPGTVTPALLRDWPLPEPGGDKYERGQLLVVGGTRTTPGAIRLAGESALRVGAGKLALAAPETAAATLAVAVPESSVLALPVGPHGSVTLPAVDPVVDKAGQGDAVLLGPGFTDETAAVSLLRAVLPRTEVPVVVDSLGTAALAVDPGLLHHLEGRAVLTVSPKELARLVDSDPDDVAQDAPARALAVAERVRAVVLCGAEEKTVVVPDGRAWTIAGGSPGLGTSGSGDTEAGIVAGLLARGASPAQAAVWGGYLHARAGERLAASVGTLGYLAREIPAQLPHVLAELA